MLSSTELSYMLRYLQNYYLKFEWFNTIPYEWNRNDIFCWLTDWSDKHSFVVSNIYDLYFKVNNGNELCDLTLEQFQLFMGNHGLDLFEDLHILISSFIPVYRISKLPIYVRPQKRPKKPSLLLKNIWMEKFRTRNLVELVALENCMFRNGANQCKKYSGLVNRSKHVKNGKASRESRYYNKKNISLCVLKNK